MARCLLRTNVLFRRSRIWVPFLLGILVNTACLGPAFPVQPTDREAEELRGSVRTVVVKSGITTTVKTYNDRGSLVEVESHRTPPSDQPELGDSVERLVYTYDPKGNRIGETIVDQTGEQYPSRLYAYDAAGHRMAEAAYHMCGTFSSLHIYTHDTQGQLREDLLYQGRTLLRNVHSYDGSGMVVKSLSYRNGAHQSTIQYIYNPNSRLTGQRVAFPDGTLSSMATYEYDDKGNRISEETSHPSHAALNSKEVHIYAYDSAGNWTKRTTHRPIIPIEEDGTRSAEPIEVTERNLTYR